MNIDKGSPAQSVDFSLDTSFWAGTALFVSPAKVGTSDGTRDARSGGLSFPTNGEAY